MSGGTKKDHTAPAHPQANETLSEDREVKSERTGGSANVSPSVPIENTSKVKDALSGISPPSQHAPSHAPASTTPAGAGTAAATEGAGVDDGVKPYSMEDDTHSPQPAGSVSPPEGGQSKHSKKRKKVVSACVYCRRSHMNCDESRPCKRCIKRNIGHLCHDDGGAKSKPREPSLLSVKDPHLSSETARSDIKIAPSSVAPENHPSSSLQSNFMPSSTALNQQPFFYSEHAGSEFNSLTEFLSMIDDNDMMDSINLTNDPMLQKLEATNYISGFTNSGTNLQNIMNNGSNVQNSSNAKLSHENLSSKAGTNSGLPNNLSLPTDVNQNLSKLDQQQLNYIQQQLNVQQQKLLQQQYSNPKPVQNQLQVNQQISDPAQLAIENGKQQPHQPYEHSIYPDVPYKTPSQQHSQLFHQISPTVQKAPQNTPHISDAARDKFFLTAADPTTEISPEERLKQVINAKLEAGLLKPYNYAKGYQRLQTYMDKYMATSSRARILKPLSTFRPGFRAIAKTLKDIDLILVEESFERMLLDYDRVFTSMAIPACLWRRTGEIYRGNKEFASLVDVSIEDLKNGKLTIYELMTEESSVNFWEKYGSIAFDKTQKAVLTSCNLRTKDGRKKKNCCFSFTIRRDRYNIPSCIVGNFIPIR